MCFSAQASFFATGLLGSIGIATLWKSKPYQVPFALIPILFSVQQLAEGVLWILLLRGETGTVVSVAQHVFLTFAFIIWPLWIPFSLIVLEKQSVRRLLLAACTLIGAFWALSALYQLIKYSMSAQISSCHMLYPFITTPVHPDIALALYTFSTIVPFFITSHTKLRFMGLLLALSCVVSYTVWHTYFISVWCFFAALISFFVYHFITNFNEGASIKS